MSARDLFLHLRLGFALALAPLFLFGTFLAGGSWDAHFWRGFLAFHLFLYGGTNAYNSYYDKDEGPIGGLARPPAVTDALWYTALLAKAGGLALALTVNRTFAAVYLCFLALSVAYSHPAVRWKADPWASALTVALGQGGLGLAAGWACADPALAGLLRPSGLLVAASALLFALGFYPLGQVYQMDEDRRRGDRTLALVLGRHGTFRFAAALIAAGGLALCLVLWRRASGWEAVGCGLYTGLLLALVGAWAARFQADEVMPNFRRAMALQYLNAACLAAYVLARSWLGPGLAAP